MVRQLVVVTFAALLATACTEPATMPPDASSAMDADTTSQRHQLEAGTHPAPEGAQSRHNPKIVDAGRTAKDTATPQQSEQDAGDPEIAESLQSCIQDESDTGTGRTDLELAVRLDCVETTRCDPNATLDACVQASLNALMIAPQSHRTRFYGLLAKCCGLHGCEYTRCTLSGR
jgi:ParB-like chromosome segregation protein Spo0J